MRDRQKTHNSIGRRYIPALWTNFQIEPWFASRRAEMQRALDVYIEKNPCAAGYFVVVQMDDGPLLKLPPDTIIYGACSGHIPLPLIYEDEKQLLVCAAATVTAPATAPVLCSFVGSNTHSVRGALIRAFSSHPDFHMCVSGGWTAKVSLDSQMEFIENTKKSTFALAPRGYGLSSFRFFEILHMGRIPVYVWDTVEWLPYKEFIDYSNFCVSVHVDEIAELPARLAAVDAAKMRAEYEKMRGVFGLEFMCDYVYHNSVEPRTEMILYKN